MPPGRIGVQPLGGSPRSEKAPPSRLSSVVIDQVTLPGEMIRMVRARWFFAALLALAAVLASSQAVERFFQVDSCLDHGGRWNHETDACQHESPATSARPPSTP
jgi:hypothetical protein